MGDTIVAILGNNLPDSWCLFEGLLCATHFISLNFHKHVSQIWNIIPILQME